MFVLCRAVPERVHRTDRDAEHDRLQGAAAGIMAAGSRLLVSFWGPTRLDEDARSRLFTSRRRDSGRVTRTTGGEPVVGGGCGVGGNDELLGPVLALGPV